MYDTNEQHSHYKYWSHRQVNTVTVMFVHAKTMHRMLGRNPFSQHADDVMGFFEVPQHRKRTHLIALFGGGAWHLTRLCFSFYGDAVGMHAQHIMH